MWQWHAPPPGAIAYLYLVPPVCGLFKCSEWGKSKWSGYGVLQYLRLILWKRLQTTPLAGHSRVLWISGHLSTKGLRFGGALGLP